jgi:hypothetical protein
MSEWYMDPFLMEEDNDILIINNRNTIESYGLNLAFAILNEALYDLRKEGSTKEEAISWFYNNDTGYVFSFINIADSFDLDPSAIRAMIEKNRPMLAFRKRIAMPTKETANEYGNSQECAS